MIRWSTNWMQITVVALVLLFAGSASASDLGSDCVVNILNRTVQVSDNGAWSLPNVPSNMGAIRARATCVTDTGTTVSGQSDYFNIVNNGVTRIGDISFANQEAVPVSLNFFTTEKIVIDVLGDVRQLSVFATYTDGSQQNVTRASSGINYVSSNPSVVTVDADGLVTAKGSGSAIVTARKDEVVAIRWVYVNVGGDMDGDGLPDDYETSHGLNPNDPADAFEDSDKDGLSALDEFNAGTDPNLDDTDGDGIKDGEELAPGTDGFVTNPLLADTDGDNLSDSLEIAVGSDPTDSASANYAAAIVSISSIPAKCRNDLQRH